MVNSVGLYSVQSCPWSLEDRKDTNSVCSQSALGDQIQVKLLEEHYKETHESSPKILTSSPLGLCFLLDKKE